MLYLNDAADFSGGATRYWAGRSRESGLLGAVEPLAGRAVLFDHGLWHDGEPVQDGTKYVLRTDVLYEQVQDAPSAHCSGPEDAGGLALSTQFAGHGGYVWSVLQRADGSLASGSRDGILRLWPLPAPMPSEANAAAPHATQLLGHTASITSVAEDATGCLWTASRDRTVRHWVGGAAEVVGRHEGAVLSLISLGARGMASGGADGRIIEWSLRKSPPVAHQGHSDWVWSLAQLTPTLLASGSEDRTIRLWRCGEDSESLSTASTHAAVRALCPLSAQVLAAGHEDGRITLWRLHTESGAAPRLELLVDRQVHDGAVCALAVVRGGRLASGGEDAQVRLSSREGLEPLASGRHADFVRTLAPLRDGRLASAGYDGTVRIWRLP